MAQKTTDLEILWRQIEQAGSLQAYVDGQMREHGFMVARKATDNMSARELARYKEELKKEASERRKLQRDAWKAYRTQHIVQLGDGVYWNDFDDWDKWDHERAEERAAENELPPLANPKQLAEALKLSVTQLRWLTFNREAAEKIHYRRFTIPKRDGSQRAIWAPMPRLKRCQRWILRNIIERLPIHGNVHGFLAGRSIRSNASVHRGSRMIVQMDIKDFFPTLSYRRVKGMFRHAGYREQIATLLALLCTESPREVVQHDGKTLYVALGSRCLPQGAPTSPAITNTICLKLDQRMQAMAAKLGWRYSRYADDMTFSLPLKSKETPRVGKLLGTAAQIVNEEGFRVNGKKTRVSRIGGRQVVTGLVVNGTSTPRVSREYRRQLRAAIHNYAKTGKLHDGETLSTLRGRAAHIASANPAEGRKLLAQIDALSPLS